MKVETETETGIGTEIETGTGTAEAEAEAGYIDCSWGRWDFEVVVHHPSSSPSDP